ncbi:MAG: hypothetical protein J3Q66DRAFT_29345 [Benniella sp.]|nr:MAG: hypothetical protein J3Q66DRAFT_29345 [Benniella sp.]
MGVKGLAKLIKSTGGQLAHGLQTKDVHVDFMGTFFGLVQAECYKVTSKQASRDFRAEAVATSSCVAPEDQAEAPATTIETVATSSSVAPEDQAEASATTIEAIGATVENTGMSVDATGVTTGRPTLGSSSTTGTDEPSIASTSTAKDPPVASKAGSPRNLKTDISTAHGTKLYIDQDGSISSNAPEKHILV